MVFLKSINEIDYYKMSSSIDGEKFYSLLGKFFCSKEVIKELDGYPIFDDQNYVWIVALKEKIVIGFYSLFIKTNFVQLDNVYVIPGERNQGVFKNLFNLAIEEVSGFNGKIKVITKYHPFYEKHGFTIKSQRGSYYYMERGM